MKRKILINLIWIVYISIGIKAQIVISVPETFTDTDNIEVIFDATQGNKGLQGYTGDVYAHTGVITHQSASGSDWKHAPEWGDNSEKYKLTPLGNDKWKLIIAPGIRSYYGVAGDERILKLAFVFRSADKTKEGKDTGNTDIFLSLSSDAFTPATPEEKARPQGIIDGINHIDESTVTFLLYAPGKKHVHLMGDFNQWKKDNNYQFYKDGDHWWYTLTGLDKNQEYAFQYLIDNTFKIGDAYCEKILDPQNDPYISGDTYPNLKAYPVETEGIVSVFKINREQYNWQTTAFAAPKKEELVIYELLIRDFTTAGTIKAAKARLDYIESLGVNAIELMPIQEFDGNDSWGYNPCFFFAADKAYGTPNDYKAFIDEAHRRGLAVILDVVFNHATAQNPFARLYWDGNATAAGNPWFNVQAPHPYSVFHDFNHEYRGTRDFFKRVLTHWIENYNIDGFRFDLTKGFTQNQSTEATASNYDPSRIAILKDYNDHIKTLKPQAYVILEHFCENREELELAQAGMMLWNNLNNAYCESLMGWKNSANNLNAGSHTSRGWTLPALVTYAESHDEERTMYKAGAYGNWTIKQDKALALKRAQLNASFLLMTPGPKMIWQFGEVGYDISIDENGRTGRKPLLWEYYDQANRRALYDTYASLIDFRNENAGLFASPEKIDLQAGSDDWENGRAIRLSGNKKNIVLLGNFTPSAINMNAGFTANGSWTELFSGESVDVAEATKNQSVALQPHSFKLFRLLSGTGNDPLESNLHYNPHSQLLTVFLDGVTSIVVYNMQGSVVAKGAASEVNLGHTPPGVYIVNILSKGKPYYNKIV
ncbi:MAG: T9SS type A sorting domain-containing protein, partial [Tannerella sp.]|nr:T9SS type A sorting domain-containing protein [Tannerella sp.]